MRDTDVSVVRGIRLEHRRLAAVGYWEAFRQKLRVPLGPESRALDFITANINPSHAISAVSAEGTFLGVAGFKTATGAFVGGGLADLARVYGWSGASWRGVLIGMLERRLEPQTLLMDGVFVLAEARGKGVGRRLLDAIQAHAITLGLRRVRLDVIDTNPRARALYEREGFVPIAERSIGPFRHVFGFRSATTMVREAAA